MKRPHPELIGTTELWSGRLYLDAPLEVSDIQAAVTSYVTQSEITVVGYYTSTSTSTTGPPALTLLRWPETRPGYASPTIPQCNVALDGLALQLQAKSIGKDVVPAGKIHTMMGRKKNGYQKGEIVPLRQLEQKNLPGFSVTEAYMVSARTVAGREVEPYGEPVGIIEANPEHEAAIHEIGNACQQHHYPIAHGAQGGVQGRTDFYQTPWARSRLFRWYLNVKDVLSGLGFYSSTP